MMRTTKFWRILLSGLLALAIVGQAGNVSAGINIWTGNGPTGVQVNSLAINPVTSSTLYAGTWDGGVFKSTDSGGSWDPVNTDLGNLHVQALAIDPAAPATIYAGTWGGGVFKSTNAAGNWAPANTNLANTNVVSLAIDPLTSGTLYAGTAGGVFKSTDSAGSWQAVNNGMIVSYVNALAIDPTNPSIVYAGTNTDGVYKSMNGGGSWSDSDTGLPAYINCLAINPALTSTIYAGTLDNGLYKSTNSGGSWVPVNNGLTSAEIYTLQIDPGTPDTLYVGTSQGVYKSTDGGAWWNQFKLGLPNTDTNDLKLDPLTSSTLYAGERSGGVFSRQTAASPANQTLVIHKSGTGSGTVTSNPGGIDCGSTCFHDFASGTQVTLSAAPVPPAIFAGWSGEGCSGTGTCTVSMTAARLVTATFDLPVPQTLTVDTDYGSGTGTVTSNPAGIDCGATCAFDFAYGTVVTLTAAPDASSKFAGWDAAGCSGTGTCTVTMNTARSVYAIFNLADDRTLTVYTNGGYGSGTVTSDPAGINCGLTCSFIFANNTVVTLTAAADPTSIFVGWSGGGCSGTGTCSVTMNADKVVTAIFDDTGDHTLTVHVNNGTGLGTVTSSPPGINCGVTCSFVFPYNTQVTLAAVPDANSFFLSWDNACSGTGPCVVKLNSNKTVEAYFDLNPKWIYLPLVFR